MSCRIFEALQFAKLAHEGQLRKYTGEPYVTHPIRVAALVMLRPDATEAMTIAALLHDVPEDTKFGLEDVAGRFGTEVAGLVDELTNKSKGSNAPRTVRKKLDRDRLAGASREAKIIKLLDRLDNLRDMAGADPEFGRKYADESLLLLKAIGDADPGLAALISEAVTRVVCNGD